LKNLWIKRKKIAGPAQLNSAWAAYWVGPEKSRINPKITEFFQLI
jgi:hypothetical protein